MDRATNKLTLEESLDRLDDLASLEDGWLDGEGLAVKRDIIEFVRSKMSGPAWPQDLAYPYIFPTVAGGLELCWDFGRLTENSLAMINELCSWDGIECDLDFDGCNSESHYQDEERIKNNTDSIVDRISDAYEETIDRSIIRMSCCGNCKFYSKKNAACFHQDENVRSTALTHKDFYNTQFVCKFWEFHNVD